MWIAKKKIYKQDLTVKGSSAHLDSNGRGKAEEACLDLAPAAEARVQGPVAVEPRQDFGKLREG